MRKLESSDLLGGADVEVGIVTVKKRNLRRTRVKRRKLCEYSKLNRQPVCESSATLRSTLSSCSLRRVSKWSTHSRDYGAASTARGFVVLAVTLDAFRSDSSSTEPEVTHDRNRNTLTIKYSTVGWTVAFGSCWTRQPAGPSLSARRPRQSCQFEYTLVRAPLRNDFTGPIPSHGEMIRLKKSVLFRIISCAMLTQPSFSNSTS